MTGPSYRLGPGPAEDRRQWNRFYVWSSGHIHVTAYALWRSNAPCAAPEGVGAPIYEGLERRFTKLVEVLR